MLSPALFKGFHQLAYVTNDLDRAIAAFGERYGVPEFRKLPEGAFHTDLGVEFRLRSALCYVGAMQLELIEPMGGDTSFFTRLFVLPGFNLSLHHASFRLASLEELETLRRSVLSRGHAILLGGDTGSGGRFFYVDARSQLGHDLEYVYISPGRDAFYAALPHH
jgi:hypothetical protein